MARTARVGARLAQFLGERALPIEPLGDVLDRDDEPDRVVAFLERADHDALLHVRRSAPMA